MDWLPAHKGGLILRHNDHLSMYMTAKHWIEDQINYSLIEEEELIDRAEMEATNNIWTLQWYPDTPVGFLFVAAPSLEKIQEYIKQHHPPTVELCGHSGGVGIGAGHECRCVREKGHPLDSDRPHGCSCWALWSDDRKA